MQSSYDLKLVLLSILVAALASYTVLDLTGRIVALRHTPQRKLWLLMGAVAMGGGIWAMHFIGMLAFGLGIRLAYDPSLTGLSLGFAIAVAYLALNVASAVALSKRRLILSGLLMTLGISGMHYTGMAAMRMQPAIQYRLDLFALSLIIAMLASVLAIWAVRILGRAETQPDWRQRCGVVGLLTLAISGMHYAGMAAAVFPVGSMCGVQHGISAEGLVWPVTAVVVMLLALTLVSARFTSVNLHLAGVVEQVSGQMHRLASIDMLTELPNRRSLTAGLERLMDDSNGEPAAFAVLFMDLDGFKTINDSLGHTVGDQVLQAFAHRLKACFRATDMVCRLGGDEFVVVLSEQPSVAEVTQVIEHMLTRMRGRTWRDGMLFQVLPSVGVARYPQDGRSVEVLLKHADIAMYEAKRAGRGTYRFFDASMNQAVMRALQIQQGLHEALAHDGFQLHFQPKFNANSGQLLGAEALLRFNHPELGPVSPQEFIGMAEQSGLIVQIGEWVVRAACKQLRRWADAGLPSLKIALNLSPRQLIQSELLQSVLDIVTQEGVAPAALMFEITETVAMQDAALTAETIHAFQQAGFDVAIDDFGMGYSSLAYLQRFKVRQLKIDGFFTQGLDAGGSEGEAIVAAIIALAHSLGMDVVAEGVETPAQLAKLKTLQCDQIQGFLLGRPMAADAFAAQMANWQHAA